MSKRGLSEVLSKQGHFAGNRTVLDFAQESKPLELIDFGSDLIVSDYWIRQTLLFDSQLGR